MNQRPGCFSGLLKLLLLDWLFEFFEHRFGFGRRTSCSGCGCGIIILIVFIILACYIVGGTNWGSFRF